MNYVLTHTMEFLVQRGTDPGSSEIILILPHPNGWGEDEQKILKAAAMNTEILRRRKVQIHFVEEAEAAARYCFPSPRESKFKLKVRVEALGREVLVYADSK